MTSPAELVHALPLWAWLLIDVLAAARLTRLMTRDSLPYAKRIRDTVLIRWGESPWSELVVCPWCFGFWAAVLAVLGRLVVPAVWSPLALALAGSMLIGLLLTRVDAD